MRNGIPRICWNLRCGRVKQKKSQTVLEKGGETERGGVEDEHGAQDLEQKHDTDKMHSRKKKERFFFFPFFPSIDIFPHEPHG